MMVDISLMSRFPIHMLNLLWQSFGAWRRDRGTRLSAALSYYTLFSLSPLIAICISLLGLLFGRDVVEQHIISEISAIAGQMTANAVTTMISGTGKHQANWYIASIGFVVLIVAAIGVFAELKDALNTIWRVKDDPKAGIWAMVRFYLAPMTMLLGIGFLLLVSMVISTGLAAFSSYISQELPIGAVLIWLLDVVISTVIITVLFAVLYRYIPDAKVAWMDVWGGALVASLLFAIGRYLIGFYLGKAGLASTYGAAGSLVAILVWVYYSAQILYFGAEFTRLYAYRYGSRKHVELPPDA